MDSRSRRLPFCLSGSRTSYVPSTPSAPISSSLGSGRLYNRESTLNNNRIPRVSTPYKADVDKQTSRLLSSSREFSGASTSSSWRLPSLTSSNRSYERPWAGASYSSRNKTTEERVGMRSGLLTSNDDAESKRAKLSYSSKGLYQRASGTPVTGSSYPSSSSSSRTGKQTNPLDSSRSSCRLLASSLPSKSLLSRREQLPRDEPGLSRLSERRAPTPELVPSLYQSDRVMSTYAQGARPKESTYSSTAFSVTTPSSSSTVRERSLGRHLSCSQRASPLTNDFSSRTDTRLLTGLSSTFSRQQVGTPEYSSVSSSVSSSSSSLSPGPLSYSSSLPRPETTPSRPGPDFGEPDGRRSTRRLLTRLFSRRSSQDSSSGSSTSARSLDEDSPSTSGDSVDSDEGVRSPSADRDPWWPENPSSRTRGQRVDLAQPDTSIVSARSHLADLTSPDTSVGSVPGPAWADLSPIQEEGRVSAGLLRSPSPTWRESVVGRTSPGRAVWSPSWLSSSMRRRCPPLLSRLRRHARQGSAQAAAGSEEVSSHPLLRRWDDLEQPSSQDEDEDDNDEEQQQGAEGMTGPKSSAAAQAHRPEEQSLPDLEEASRSLLSRAELLENITASMGPQVEAESKPDGPAVTPSRDQEKLRKIKEKLLQEDSDEEEGDLCRICQMGEESSSNPLIQPCRCTGSLQFVHQDCIKRWLRSKISSGTNLEAITTCELCKEKLRLNIDNFDIHELYRTHVQSEYDDFISSGLYLVVLLHFCEQRFSDVLGTVDAAGLFNLVRILHEHMDNLEILHEDEDETQDSRPSVDFSDLDDDLDDDY